MGKSFIYVFTLLGISHSAILLPTGHSSQDWARPNPGTGNSGWVSHMGGREQLLMPSPASPQAVLKKKLKLRTEPRLIPWHSAMECACLSQTSTSNLLFKDEETEAQRHDIQWMGSVPDSASYLLTPPSHRHSLEGSRSDS